MPKTDVKVKLLGRNGNAFAIMGAVKQAMKRMDVDKAIIDEYLEEAMSGDYDNLLITTMKYVEVI
jgi:hypothetical protein